MAVIGVIVLFIFSSLIAKGFGLLLILFGSFIILSYWYYYIQCFLVAMGWLKKEMKYVSFSPLIAPISVIIGVLLFGKPLSNYPIWWVFFVDSNTYLLLGTIYFLIVEVLSKHKSR